MNRGSFVGPLLLIAVGSLFLARNVFPELAFMDYLARYWPYLLILWGGLRLVEIFVWASAGKPLPVYGISGGEWGLVVFVCMIGLTANAARGFSNWLPRGNFTMGGLDMFGESYDYNVAGEKASSKTPRVVLQTFRGDARITGADVDSVKVTGHNTIRSMDKNDADRANSSTPFEVAGDANQITIRTNQDRVSLTQRVSSILEITVPRGASLELHGRRGNLEITGVNGTVDIDSDNAGVRLENIAGAVRVDVRSSDVVRATNLKSSLDIKGRGGDIEIDNIEGQVNVNGSFSGITQVRNVAKSLHYNGPFTDLTMEKIPGTLRMSVGDVTAHGLIGPFHLSTTRSKDVELTDITNSIDINLNRGDIRIHPGAGPTPKMDLQTRRGDIELSLAPNAKFDLDGVSERGEALNDFGTPLVQTSLRRGATIKGSNGGPTIVLETKQGAVRVHKASPSYEKAPDDPKPPLRPLNQ